jgi:tetratricopeptide (TPR) repeat protein
MTSAAQPAVAGSVPGSAFRPVRIGTVPPLAEGFIVRPETAPGLTALLRPGSAVALVPGRAAEPGRGAQPGPSPVPAGQDWSRSSGKTQLAAASAESLWQSGEVDLLVWIDATSRASVLAGYAAATAEATGRHQASSSESVAIQFVDWLSETSCSWLVVLDDLADAATMDGLWPSGPSGRILVTARDAAAVPGGMQVLPVGPFNSREALGYLMGRLANDPSQRLGAVELINELAFEPAALAQASAVILSSGVSCHNYRDYFIQRRDALTETSGAPPSPAAVTWMFSFEYAGQLTAGGSAKFLLALAAMLDGHAIPRSVLATPAAGEYQAGTAGASGGREGAGAALEALERAGLLTAESAMAPPTVLVSPVLQTSLRAAMPDDMKERTARAAADALLEAWPERDSTGWPASGMRACAAALRQAAGDLLWAGGCHPVLLRAGESLDRVRLTGPAVDHWLDLATTSDRLLGAGHPDTMLACQRLADAYLAAGRADDAVPWFQWLLDTQAHRRVPDHRDVLEARRRLGHALVAAHQSEDAITALERAVADFERICGPGHTDTLGAQDELAAAYLAAGRHSDAITMYQQTLGDRERGQGASHPQTMTTRQGLGDAYLAGGRSKDAVAVYKRVQAGRERVLGPDHLDTIKARNSLGAAYQKMGKAAAAEQAYEQARAGFERVLGPRHPDTLRCRVELARVYGRLGRYGDERALLRGTVDRLERTLPKDDPLIRELRESLADIGEE